MLNQRIRKRYYTTLGTIVINSPLSPPYQNIYTGLDNLYRKYRWTINLPLPFIGEAAVHVTLTSIPTTQDKGDQLLRLFWVNPFPILQLLMSCIWHSGSRSKILTSYIMTQCQPRFEPITFLTTSRCFTCWATVTVGLPLIGIVAAGWYPSSIRSSSP